MSDTDNPNAIHTRIWREEPEPDNPFATRVAWCRGYDVYGEMLGPARWVEMLYLLFREEAPTVAQADLLEALAVALANPGPRDASVHAAMCGGVCGSTAASSLMAALAVGAGQLAGGHEVFLAMEGWAACGTHLDAWRKRLGGLEAIPGSIWPTPEHPPGFDPPWRQHSHFGEANACLSRPLQFGSTLGMVAAKPARSGSGGGLSARIVRRGRSRSRGFRLHS